MKKVIIAAAMAVVAITAGAQVNNDLSDDDFFGVVPAKTNAADYEFRPDVESDRFNYYHVMEKKQPHKDVIPMPIGNNLEGTHLYSVDNHGSALYLQADATYFADRLAYGGGVGLGHEYRDWGLNGKFKLLFAKPDKASDDQSTYLQERVDLSIYLKVLNWKYYHGGLKVGATGSLQLSQYIKKDGWVTVDTESTGDGKVTTTTETVENINLRDFVSGGDLFVEVYGRKAFSSWGWYLGVAGGMMQNILLNDNKFYPEVRLYFGIEFRFNRHASYNKKAMKRLNLTEEEVWDMRHGSKPYQKPGERK